MNGAFPMTAFALRPVAVRHPLAAGVMRLAYWLGQVALALRRAGMHLDGWFATRAKARQDSALLQGMSERELRDIGVDPARLGVRGDAWTRDWPG